MLFQHRFGIEQIHLARRAIHEELDNGFRFCREMRRARGFRSYTRRGLFPRQTVAAPYRSLLKRETSAAPCKPSTARSKKERRVTPLPGWNLSSHIASPPQSMYKNAAEFISV